MPPALLRPCRHFFYSRILKFSGIPYPSPQRQKFGPQTPIEVQNLPKGIDLVKKDYFCDPPPLLGPGPSILGALPLHGPWQGGILAGKVARILPGSLEISYAR